MRYIVFDLEYNQVYNPLQDSSIKKDSKCPFEIIQIGAIRLNNNKQFENLFNELIKPKIYPVINPYITKLTRITDEDLKGSLTFEHIANEFINFIGGEEVILIVWGKDDIKELFRNLNYYDIKSLVTPIKYIDLQAVVSRKYQCTKGINMSLKNAINVLGISKTLELHDAYNDAYYTSEIFKIVSITHTDISIFNPNIKKAKMLKTKLESKLFFNQIEKQFDRKLTNEEKEMLKVAYFMGKSHQFQVVKKNKNQV